MSAEWRLLIERFKPSDKRICNCGNAYYTHFTAATNTAWRNGVSVDHWGCKDGCDAAQIRARDHVASEVIAALRASGSAV